MKQQWGFKISSRLAKLEVSLGKASHPAETSLYHRVLLEAEQQLSPDERALVKSAQAARSEGRYHSLEEDEAKKKLQRLAEGVAQRYGRSYVGLLRDHIGRPGKSKRSARELGGIAEALVWGRNNLFHVLKLRKVQQASQSSSSVSDPSSGSTN